MSNTITQYSFLDGERIYHFVDPTGGAHIVSYTNITKTSCRRNTFTCHGEGTWACENHTHPADAPPPALFVGTLDRKTPERYTVLCPDLATINCPCTPTETQTRRGGTKRKYAPDQ